MSKNIRIIIMLALLIPALFCYSQEAQDTVMVERLDLHKLVSFETIAYSSSEYHVNGFTGEVEMEEYRFNFLFPLQLKKHSLYLLTGSDISKFDVRSKTNLVNVDNNYYAFRLDIGVLKILKNNWRLTALVGPTFASDFKLKLSTDDFIFQASTFVTKRVSRYWQYGFGAAYNTRLGRPVLVPLLATTYKRNHFKLKVFFPYTAEAHYIFNDKTTMLGSKTTINGYYYSSSHNLSTSLNLTKLGYSRINTGVDFQVELFKSFYLNLFTGATINNRLESVDSNGELELDLSTKTKFFASIGLLILK